MRAIILAAGEGKKFFPYDLTRQKAAVTVANRPLISWTVEWLRKAGVEEIAVVVGYLEERVRNALRNVPDITYVRQQQRRGTAWAVIEALKSIGEDDSVLVIYGDVLISPDALSDFIRQIADRQPFAAALVTPIPTGSAGNWIVAHISDGALEGISGHGRGGGQRMAGIYWLSKQALPYLYANPGVVEDVPVGGMPPMEAELAQSFALMAADGREVMAVVHQGMFVDIDKPWHLLEANERMAEHLCGLLDADEIAPTAKIDDGAEISGPIVVGPETVIGKRVVIGGPAIIGARTSITNGAIIKGCCVIGNEAKLRDYCLVSSRTVIEDECIVGHGAEMGGVLMRGAYLYHYCEMAGVFGARFDAGAGTLCGTLRFDDGNTVHVVRGRKEVPECHANVAYVGDFTRTGVGAILMPGVKVGAYSCVGPGVVLYEDVEHRTMVLVKQQLTKRPWGPEQYGW